MATKGYGKVVAFRVEPEVHTVMMEYAMGEGRSVSGWLQALVLREVRDRQDRGVTLEDVDRKLNRLLEKLEEQKGRKRQVRGEKRSPLDVWEDEDVCSRESWEAWVGHKRSLGQPMNEYLAQKHFEQLREFREEEWDCDQLIRYVIEKGHGTLYVPAAWRQEG